MDDQACPLSNRVVKPNGSPIPPGLDLNTFPIIYVLPTHIDVAELHAMEHQLTESGAALTYDICEARLVLGNISKPRRAKFELQAGRVRCKDVHPADLATFKFEPLGPMNQTNEELPTRKRRKVQVTDSQSTTSESTDPEAQDNSPPGPETETEDDGVQASQSSVLTALSSQSAKLQPHSVSRRKEECPDLIKVINLDWLRDSLRLGEAQDIRSYLIYVGQLLSIDKESPSPKPSEETVPQKMVGPGSREEPNRELYQPMGILARAKAETAQKVNSKAHVPLAAKRDRIANAAKRDFANRSFTSTTSRDPLTHRPHLIHQSTSEYEESATQHLPPLPEWITQKQIYACQRATPLTSPNDAFIAQLKEIKLARLLTNDDIGVRAYSTSIASLAAYPYRVQSSNEILALPGCDQKIAHLFHEWQTSPDHRIQAVEDIENDPALKVLALFHDIWGVGATTAREFYYDRKWHDLDDIVEFGWNILSRVQQIGIKYYDDFLLKIPRAEVETIAGIVERHARNLIDDEIVCVIVGGYRRGKAESGDVDLILSHPKQSATAGLVDQVVQSLEKEGWVTHTLTLNLTNTKRGQETLPYVTSTKGAGFDTLDKALVVWQDQAFSGQRIIQDAPGEKLKNPNPHRRVDIIVSPWRTIGCAVAGWTSGTTFQRDLRRYAKKVKGWKFDSSGIRERGSGKWIDVEGWLDPETRCTNWEEAEKKVFESLGLEYREPQDRCTG
ncbi:MAG: hypothetical protein LQ350_002167 [Teloschistes chrysophthalmus]|nr:MAG: hypothetical protein LQ350_002167 [Niorma chrysophthalma]